MKKRKSNNPVKRHAMMRPYERGKRNSESKGIVPLNVIGYVYPDLYTQHKYLIEKRKKYQNCILSATSELFECVGEEAIIQSVDAMFNYLSAQVEILKQCSGITAETLQDITSDMFGHSELTKCIVRLFVSNEHLIKIDEDLELTRSGVLM